MKKFCIKITILVGIVVLLLFVYNSFFTHYVIKTDDSVYSVAKYEKVPTEIEVANMGSSHGVHGFNYTHYSDKYNCFNFALLAQMLSYDWRILQYYGEYMNDGSVLIIPVSYFSLYFRDETLLNNFESKNESYYKILPPELVKEYSPTKAILMKYCQSLSYSPDVALAMILQSGTDNKSNEDNTSSSYSMDHKQFQASARKAYQSHCTENQVNGELVVNQEEYDALINMVNYCHDNDIRAILITTPFRYEYNAEWDNNFYEMFYSDLANIVSETSVEYYDYSHDNRFTNRDDYFDDADHLSDAGALVFTDIVFEEVIKNK